MVFYCQPPTRYGVVTRPNLVWPFYLVFSQQPVTALQRPPLSHSRNLTGAHNNFYKTLISFYRVVNSTITGLADYLHKGERGSKL